MPAYTASSTREIIFPNLKNPVGPIGFGLMSLTTAPPLPTDDVAFAAIKLALDSGAYLNSADFYGPMDNPTANLSLISRFFAAYPSLAANAVLGVKGGIINFKPRLDAEYLAQSIERMNSILGPHRPGTVIFIPARVDKSIPISTVMSTLVKHVKSGEIQGVGLSEASAATIRAAHAVYPLSCVEIEVSLMSPEALTNGVADTCRELGIPITAYSPLGRGILAGKFKKPDDLAKEDFRHSFDRFQGENFVHNLTLAEEVKAIADRAGVTSAQLLLAWVRNCGDNLDGPVKSGQLTVVPIPGGSNEGRVRENLKEVEILNEVFSELEGVIKRLGVSGSRYNAEHNDFLYG